MHSDTREVMADWLIVFGAVGLLVALFLPWSRQRLGPVATLQGVPRSPTAWQTYSVVDVGMAVLAAALVGVALLGRRTHRVVVLVAAAAALAFAVHAHDRPPTKANLTAHARPGAGETVAIAALGVAIAGLALSFTAE